MTASIKTDTTPAAARVQAEALWRLPPARRLALAIDMSLMARGLLVARLRLERPGWSESSIRHEWLRLTFPDAIPPPSTNGRG